MKKTNRLPKASNFVSFAAFSLAATVALSACGKKDSDKTDVTSTTSVVTLSSLDALPDLSLLLKSDATKAALSLGLRGSSDASNGTPPEMRSVTEEQVETYLTGSIDDFIAEVEAARDEAVLATGAEATTKWDAVQAKVKTFRQAQTKCRVLEDTVRQVSDLSEHTSTMCYMSKIGVKGAGILGYKSGTKVEDGDFFKASTEKDVIRKVEMRKGSAALALEEGGDEDKDGGDQDIYFSLPKASDTSFSVELSFCNPADGSLRNIETVTVDKVKGEMTFTHVGSDTRGGQTQKQMATLIAALKQDADGKLSFDSTKARVVEARNEGGFSSEGGNVGTHLFNGRFTVKGDVLLSEMFMKGSNTFEGNTNTHSSKNVSAARFSGSKMKDVRVFEGAGRMSHSGSGTFGGQAQTFTDDQKIAFEYDQAATPRYKSVATNEYLTQVDALFGAKDKAGSILAGTAPKSVDISKLTSGKAICKSTPDSIYTLGATAAARTGFMKVEKACNDGRGFNGENSLCRTLQNREREIMQALWQRKQSGK